MAMPAEAALWFLPFVLPIAMWVAWSDMSRMKIPNKAVLALLGVFLLVGPFVLPFGDWAWRWVHFAVVLAAGFVLSSIRVMGAGDAKFAAAMAPFIAADDVRLLLLLLAAVIPASLVTHRAFRAVPAVRRATPGWESWTRPKEFPFGLPLAGTLVLYLAAAVLL